VVTVLSGHRTHVERHARAVDEALPEFFGELRVEGADPFGDRGDFVHVIRTPGQVERNLHEGLVQRHERVREPADALLVA